MHEPNGSTESREYLAGTEARNGKVLKISMWYAQDTAVGYGVGWWDEPERLAWFGGLDGFFDFTVRGLLEKTEFKLVGQVNRHPLGETPGVAFMGDYSKGDRQTWGRLYLHDSRAYMVMAIADDRSRSKSVETFLESFRLLH